MACPFSLRWCSCNCGALCCCSFDVFIDIVIITEKMNKIWKVITFLPTWYYFHSLGLIKAIHQSGASSFVFKKRLGSSLSCIKSWRQKNSKRSEWLFWRLVTRKDWHFQGKSKPSNLYIWRLTFALSIDIIQFRIHVLFMKHVSKISRDQI